MSYQQLKKRTEGFTIIEVLIVLAIAGLILLIVFLAVPALQRNSRNTSRRDDVARVLGAAQEVLNNNNGDVSALTPDKLRDAVGNLSYYQSANIDVQAGSGLSATKGSDTDSVVVYTGAKCTDAETADPGTSRQLVALFAVESKGVVSQCTAS